MRKKWHAVVFLTTECQLRCRHCLVWKNRERLSLRDLERIRDWGPRKVNLMGGEPLLYPFFERALEIFSDIPVTVQTNGLLAKENLEALKRVRQVIVSIEGGREFTDYVRGKGVFDKVMEAVKFLRENNVNVILRSSLWREMLQDVPALMSLSEELDVPLYFFPMVGKAPLSVEEQVWLFNTLQRSDRVWLDLPQYFNFLGRNSYCSAGESRLAFWSNRLVTPCQFLEYFLGTLDSEWEVIEENADTFARTKHPPSSCLGCDRAHICRGGCLLTPFYTGCPMRPTIRPFVEQGFDGRRTKSENLRVLLSGVVTC